MNNKLETLLQSFEGNWISHQTVYSLQKKDIKVNKQYIHVNNFNSIQKDNNQVISYLYKDENTQTSKNNILYQYIYKNAHNVNSGVIYKTYMNTNIIYQFKLYYGNYLKISYTAKDVNYTEYVYSVNQNLKMSIIMIKMMYRYVAICFTSKIRINKLP